MDVFSGQEETYQIGTTSGAVLRISIVPGHRLTLHMISPSVDTNAVYSGDQPEAVNQAVMHIVGPAADELWAKIQPPPPPDIDEDAIFGRDDDWPPKRGA